MAGGSSNPHHKADTVPRTGLVWGVDRGHKTERRVQAERPSRRKGKLSQRKAVVNSVVREVVGFAPYERRAMELIRNSKVSNRVGCAWMMRSNGCSRGTGTVGFEREEGVTRTQRAVFAG